MLKSSSTSNLSLLFLMCCTSPKCGYLHSKSLAFEEDDLDALANIDALAFSIDEKEGLALEVALPFYPLTLKTRILQCPHLLNLHTNWAMI
ncbi:hypothetical protein Tco_0762217 [Tanacetum coccineum]